MIAVTCAATLSSRGADDPRRKDSLALLSQMRVKRLTKELSLTEEQQKKMLALYDDEAKQLAVIQADPSLNINQSYEKQMAIKKVTDAKVPPLLTAEQKTKYEAYVAKITPKKKPAAVPAPQKQ